MAGIMDLLVPALLMGGGYAIKQNAQKKADKKRNAIIQNMQTMTTDATRSNVQNIADTSQMYTPEVRMPAYEQAANKNVQSLTADVTAPQEVPLGPQYGGTRSEAFSRGAATRARDDLAYSTRLARLMGRAAAPADLGLNENFSNVDSALERDRTNSRLNGQLGVEGLRADSVEPNGGQMLAGDLMTMGGVAAGRAPEPDYLSMLRAGMNGQGTPPPVATKPAVTAPRPQVGTADYWKGGRRAGP
jgi:hypothetical protein